MLQIANYRRYKQMKLRNAWMLAGMDQVVLPFLRGALLAFVILLAYAVVTHTVEASQSYSEQAAAVKVAKQAVYIQSLETTLAKCLSGGDNMIVIGDEIWACGAANTGVKWGVK